MRGYYSRLFRQFWTDLKAKGWILTSFVAVAAAAVLAFRVHYGMLPADPTEYLLQLFVHILPVVGVPLWTLLKAPVSLACTGEIEHTAEFNNLRSENTRLKTELSELKVWDEEHFCRAASFTEAKPQAAPILKHLLNLGEAREAQLWNALGIGRNDCVGLLGDAERAGIVNYRMELGDQIYFVTDDYRGPLKVLLAAQAKISE